MKGMVLSREEFDKELDKFYQIRGWDKEGIPTRDKLEKLGLDDIP